MFIDATMMSDEAPFSIVNVACHGCQDEMRSTSDTHELETRQLVLCISVREVLVLIMFNQPVVYECFGSSFLGDSPNNLGGYQLSDDMGIQSAIILTVLEALAI